MRAMELLILIGEADSKYLLEAEAPGKGARPVRKRALVLAAAIAAALLLAGCAAAAFLRLQDMQVGRREYTRSFDEQGKPMAPETRTMDELSFYGYGDSPAQQAARELNDFYRTYDPEGKKIPENDRAEPGIPERYYTTYRCYTREMMEKVDEIAGKYGLKLLEEELVAQTWQFPAAQRVLGIENLLLPDSQGRIRPNNALIYLPRDFRLNYELTLADSLLWPYGVQVDQHYSSKNYLAPGASFALDLADYDQWEYRTAAGQPLLLALNQRGEGLIVAEQAEAIATWAVTGNRSGSDYPAPEDVLTKTALEEIAEQFDYSLRPADTDAAALNRALQEADAAHQAELERARQCADLGEYLKKNALRFRSWSYAFYDFYGDGADTILLSRDGKHFYWAITLRNGEAEEQLLSGTVLLENGGMMDTLEDPTTGEVSYTFHGPTAQGTPVRHGAYTWEFGDWLFQLRKSGDQWSKLTDFSGKNPPEAITAAQAEEILAQYPEKALSWTPVWDFPMADGRTLGETLEAQDQPLSPEQLREKYREYLRDKGQYSYYAFRDINGDGREDLLLSDEPDGIRATITYRYGGFYSQVDLPGYVLCEGNVLMLPHLHRAEDGSEETEMLFYRFVSESRLQCFAQIRHNKAYDTYEEYGTASPRSPEEAKAIVQKYAPIDPGMKPVSELPG